ncbi:MAG: YsnF/AvaK domain-containing protein [Actinomycetota bacterium]|nr:YsnF/AvaK domain-containing protein [Actinomycetota bacterium]
MRRTAYYLKLAAAGLAAGVLAKFLRDRFSRSESAGGDTADTAWQPTRREVEDTMAGEERSDRADKATEREDELRVQRTEEELRAGTREREVGEVGVRKTVRTDRESVEVPTRREEITVDRVPVEGEASETEIGEDEVSVPVTEEEVVVDKRPVAKEEIRIRKDVVEDTEVVEEDVRREEIEIDDETTGRTP